MNNFLTVFLIIVAITGVYIQYKIDFKTKKEKGKSRLGLIIFITSLAGILGSNIKQHLDSVNLQDNFDSLQVVNRVLSHKLDSCNNSIRIANNSIDSIQIKADSLLVDNKYLKYVLNRTESNLIELGKKTEKGFDENQKKISEIKQVAVKKARKVPENIRELMTSELSKYKEKSIQFFTVNTYEALQFSSTLQNIYRESGWTVNNNLLLAPGEKAIGIGFELNPNYSENVRASYQLLELLNYKLVPIRKNELSTDELNIIIGFQE